MMCVFRDIKLKIHFCLFIVSNIFLLPNNMSMQVLSRLWSSGKECRQESTRTSTRTGEPHRKQYAITSFGFALFVCVGGGGGGGSWGHAQEQPVFEHI